MQQANMLEAIEYNDENIVITQLLATAFSKEIRIVMQKHQVMRDHESDHPVTLYVVDELVNLSIEEKDIVIKKGNLVTLEGGVKHHLKALDDTVLHLTIYLCKN